MELSCKWSRSVEEHVLWHFVMSLCSTTSCDGLQKRLQFITKEIVAFSIFHYEQKKLLIVIVGGCSWSDDELYHNKEKKRAFNPLCKRW